MRKMMLAMILMLPAAGCQSVVSSDAALCSGSAAARRDHAAALAVSPDGASVVTGARLIRLIDAGCGG